MTTLHDELASINSKLDSLIASQPSNSKNTEIVTAVSAVQSTANAILAQVSPHISAD